MLYGTGVEVGVGVGIGVEVGTWAVNVAKTCSATVVSIAAASGVADGVPPHPRSNVARRRRTTDPGRHEALKALTG